MAGKKQTYESMIKRLEEIVSKMENEQLSLEEAIKNYEEGIKLSNNLYKILNDVEGKINILTEDGEKQFKLDNEE